RGLTDHGSEGSGKIAGAQARHRSEVTDPDRAREIRIDEAGYSVDLPRSEARSPRGVTDELPPAIASHFSFKRAMALSMHCWVWSRFRDNALLANRRRSTTAEINPAPCSAGSIGSFCGSLSRSAALIPISRPCALPSA